MFFRKRDPLDDPLFHWTKKDPYTKRHLMQNVAAIVVRHAQSDTANLPPEPPAKDVAEARKIGDGHAMAMLRLGAHELTNALAAFPDSNIRPQEEPGIFGNPTPQIVTQEMTGQEVNGRTDELNRAAQRGPSPEREKGRTR